MKRFVPFLLILIISLSSCSVKSAPTLECVNDTILQNEIPSFYIEADYPAAAALTASCDDGCCAVFSHSDYDIYQEIFPAQSIDEALLNLAGRSDVQALRVASFPYEEYRIAYTAAGEGGTISCLGKIYYDGEFCYALVIHCPIEKEKDYRETFADLISTATIEAV